MHKDWRIRRGSDALVEVISGGGKVYFREGWV